MRILSRLVLIALVFLLQACAAVDMTTAPLVLQPASYSDLPHWADDSQAQALGTLKQSCAVILKQQDSTARFGALGAYADWQAPCRAALITADAQARTFFESNFIPWQATGAGREEGLFTGYYEASLRGSRTRHDQYQYPLRALPDDLIMVDLGDFRPALKGQRIAGRVVAGHLKPYEDNRAITLGKLPPAADKPLVWVDDPVDAFFLQIQGSGAVALDDGTTMRVGYAGQNGYPYTAVGRELIRRGDLSKDDVSMQSIRAWMKAHPDKAQDVMFANQSYVFFRELQGAEGPPGAEGVPLTPGRSLAVDHARIPYGIPVWIDLDASETGTPAIQRLMVAQDTGGAIQGPVRGDFFWGHGPEAERMAGPMKSRGRMWLLLPRTVTPQ